MCSLRASRQGRRIPAALELLAAVGLALMAGFIFNMSVVTAPALDRLPPDQALAAWKAINRTVRNPLFAGTALGTTLAVIACTVLAWRSRSRSFCLGFALLYLVGVMGTTVAVEAPINRAIVLATTPPADFQSMLSTWLLANHVRALSALAAFVVAWLGFRQSVSEK